MLSVLLEARDSWRLCNQQQHLSCVAVGLVIGKSRLLGSMRIVRDPAVASRRNCSCCQNFRCHEPFLIANEYRGPIAGCCSGPTSPPSLLSRSSCLSRSLQVFLCASFHLSSFLFQLPSFSTPGRNTYRAGGPVLSCCGTTCGCCWSRLGLACSGLMRELSA